MAWDVERESANCKLYLQNSWLPLFLASGSCTEKSWTLMNVSQKLSNRCWSSHLRAMGIGQKQGGLATDFEPCDHETCHVSTMCQPQRACARDVHVTCSINVHPSGEIFAKLDTEPFRPWRQTTRGAAEFAEFSACGRCGLREISDATSRTHRTHILALFSHILSPKNTVLCSFAYFKTSEPMQWLWRGSQMTKIRSLRLCFVLPEASPVLSKWLMQLVIHFPFWKTQTLQQNWDLSDLKPAMNGWCLPNDWSLNGSSKFHTFTTKKRRRLRWWRAWIGMRIWPSRLRMLCTCSPLHRLEKSKLGDQPKRNIHGASNIHQISTVSTVSQHVTELFVKSRSKGHNPRSTCDKNGTNELAQLEGSTKRKSLRLPVTIYDVFWMY